MAIIKKSGFYNEFGIKISSLRLSIRFPCAPLAKKIDNEEQDYDFVQHLNEYKSDWTWVPVKAASQNNNSVKSQNKSGNSLTMRPLPPPPLPPRSPRSESPTAPMDILPPYPSSTVQRVHQRKRCSSYVWRIKKQSGLSTLIIHAEIHIF